MPELRVDVSDLKSESSDLIKELAIFLEEKANVKVETIANEIIVKGEEEAISRKLKTNICFYQPLPLA